jgi:hypothetical protein
VTNMRTKTASCAYALNAIPSSMRQTEQIRMNEAGERARKAGRVDEARKLEEAIFVRWDAKWAALPEHMKQEIEAALAKRPLVRHQD